MLRFRIRTFLIAFGCAAAPAAWWCNRLHNENWAAARLSALAAPRNKCWWTIDLERGEWRDGKKHMGWFPHVTKVSISARLVDDADFREVVRYLHMLPWLRHLDVSGAPMCDDSGTPMCESVRAASLDELASLTQIRILELGSAHICDNDLPHLYPMTHLRYVCLSSVFDDERIARLGTREADPSRFITVPGVRLLHQALPNTYLDAIDLDEEKLGFHQEEYIPDRN